MKYSILGFNQSVVLKYRKFVNRKVRGIEKEVEVRIDVTDLLLINALSDFMNRPNVIKSEVEGKNYFWVNYSTLLEDLPILNISKQALSDRLDKLYDFNIIEKKVVLNSMGTFTCFRMGKEYENIKYSSDRQCNNDDTGSYSTTRGGRSQLRGGVVVNYEPNMNTLNNEYAKEEKENTKKKKSFDVREDLSYVDEPFVSLWNEWLDYKEEIGKQYKTQRGAKMQYSSWIKFSDNNPILANAIIKRSIEQSWDGLFALTDKQREFFLSDKSPYQKENTVINSNIDNYYK